MPSFVQLFYQWNTWRSKDDTKTFKVVAKKNYTNNIRVSVQKRPFAVSLSTDEVMVTWGQRTLTRAAQVRILSAASSHVSVHQTNEWWRPLPFNWAEASSSMLLMLTWPQQVEQWWSFTHVKLTWTSGTSGWQEMLKTTVTIRKRQI